MTRIEAARRRVRITRYAIGVTAAAALAVFAAAARASHPGALHATRPSRPAVTSSATSSEYDGSFFDDGLGSSSFGPAGSAAPQIQSGGS